MLDRQFYASFRLLNCASAVQISAFHGQEGAGTDMGTVLNALERARARVGHVFCLLVDVQVDKRTVFHGF